MQKKVNKKPGKNLAQRASTKTGMPAKNSKFARTKLICKFCRAIYDGKHWLAFEKLDPTMIDEIKVNICPACHEKKDHISDGVLHLSGSILDMHKAEIKNIIANAAKREEERDVLNRIERIEESNGEMRIYTGKNQLAVELGKKINSAYKGGKIEIKWSKGDKPVEVRWHNDVKSERGKK